MNISTRITVNGHTYHSVDEMPPEVRDQYQKAMAAMRELGHTDNPAKTASPHTAIRESIVYNGRRYNSRDELPPEARALLAQAEPSAMDKNADIRIETLKTFTPRVTINEQLREDGERRAPEEDPVMAWLLVKILTIVILALLVLLGAKHLWR